MHVVEIPRDVASANVKVHTIGEIIGEIVDRPVQTVLLGLVRSGVVALIAVTELAATPIRSSDAPKFRAGRLGSPCCGRCGGFLCPNDDIILNILAKDPGSIDGQTVGISPNARDGDLAAAVDPGPVLSGLGGKVVVLEVPFVGRQNSDWFGDACGKSDASRPSAATRAGKITGNVLRNGVVEINIPASISEATCIFPKIVDRGAFCALVEIVILL